MPPKKFLKWYFIFQEQWKVRLLQFSNFWAFTWRLRHLMTINSRIFQKWPYFLLQIIYVPVPLIGSNELKLVFLLRYFIICLLIHLFIYLLIYLFYLRFNFSSINIWCLLLLLLTWELKWWLGWVIKYLMIIFIDLLSWTLFLLPWTLLLNKWIWVLRKVCILIIRYLAIMIIKSFTLKMLLSRKLISLTLFHLLLIFFLLSF